MVGGVREGEGVQTVCNVTSSIAMEKPTQCEKGVNLREIAKRRARALGGG